MSPLQLRSPVSSEKQSSSMYKIGLVHLAVVYVVWGSTYLAIRIAVADSNGFTPFLLGASRTLVAGLLLLCLAALKGAGSLRPTRRELVVLVISGLLMWVGGNGLVNWAERHADSGYAALLVGTMPLWVAIIEAIIERKAPSLLLASSLVVGFCGLILLTYPQLKDGTIDDVLALVALLAAPLCWGLGSIVVARESLQLPLTVTASYQQLFGCLGFLVVAWAAGEPLAMPSSQAWLAWLYLVVAGSMLAFTSFMTALKILPTHIVMTYAYVNPVIAVLLGWLVLDEAISMWTIFGAALILTGVAGVFRDKR